MDLSSLSDDQILAAAGVNPVSSAILGQESNNNPNSPPSIDGAIGRGQILPATFAQYAKPGEDIHNDADNLAVHNRIIDDLSQKANGDPARIAVGYFSGPGNIAPPGSPTPWINDHADGNGKRVSSYVSDVLGRIPKQTADSGQVKTDAQTDAKPDVSQLSDEQLLALIGNNTKKQDISKTESAVSGAADTTAFGFGDEIMGGLTAPVEYAGGRILGALGEQFKPDKDLSKMSLSDIYQMEKKAYSDRNNEAQQANPLTYLGGQLAGGLGTGAIGGTTKAGQAIGAITRDGLLPNATSALGNLANFATKATAGAGVGAASGALYGLGAGEDGQRIDNAKQSALYGAVAGGAAPAVANALGGVAGGVGDALRGLTARSPEALQEIASTTKKAAGAIYDKMRDVGANFNPTSTNGLLTDIDTALKKRAFIPENNESTANIVQSIEKAAENGTLSLGELDQYRSQLRNVPHGHDTVAAGDVRNAIDNFVNNASGKDLVDGAKYTAKDLANANNELDNLQNLHDHLVDSIQTKTQLAGQQRGFWRGRTITDAANEAKNLSAVKQQIALQKNTINAIQDNISNAPALEQKAQEATSLLNQGRKAYAQASKFETVSDLIQKAGGDPNKIRSRLTTFVNNKKNLRGFSDSEVKALKSVANGGISDSALKGLSAFGFDARHVAGPVLANGLAASALGGPAGIALAGAGTVARATRNLSTRGQAENLLRVLEGSSSGRSPLSSLAQLAAPSSSGRIGASNLTINNRP